MPLTGSMQFSRMIETPPPPFPLTLFEYYLQLHIELRHGSRAHPCDGPCPHLNEQSKDQVLLRYKCERSKIGKFMSTEFSFVTSSWQISSSKKINCLKCSEETRKPVTTGPEQCSIRASRRALIMHKPKRTPRQIRVPDFRSCPMIDLGRETDGNNEIRLGVRFALCIVVWNASHINIANKHEGSVYFLVHHLPCSTNTNLRNLVQSRYHLRKHNSLVLSQSGSLLLKLKASSLYSLKKCNTCQVRNKSAG